MTTPVNLVLVKLLAAKYSLIEIYYNPESRVVSFRDQENSFRVNVYYTTWTVGTCVNHPVIGKSQLFRRNVSVENLEKIFANPRVHTGLGYYRSSSKDGPDAGSKRPRLDSTDVSSELEGCGPVDDEETALKHQEQFGRTIG